MDNTIFVSDLSMLVAGWSATLYRVFVVDWKQPSARWGWLFLFGFSLSATLQQNWVHIPLGELTNIPSIAWYSRYVCWILTCYAGLRMRWLLPGGGGSTVKWNVATALILFVESLLYFIYIVHSDGNPVTIIASDRYELSFMLIVYGYSIAVLISSISSLLRSLNFAGEPRHKLRGLMLISFFLFAILFLIFRATGSIMGYMNVMNSIVPEITKFALILFVLACIFFLLFFLPQFVHEKIESAIHRITIYFAGVQLRSLYDVICPLNRPVSGAQSPNGYMWLTNPYMYVHVLMTHILDSKSIISKRLTDTESVSDWSEAEKEVARRVSTIWCRIDDDKAFDQLITDYVDVSKRIQRGG